MKKYIWLLLLLLSGLNFIAFVQAAEGVIKVLEAPLYKDENLNSIVVQYLRKGDKIYLYDGAVKNEDYVQMDTVFTNEEEGIAAWQFPLPWCVKSPLPPRRAVGMVLALGQPHQSTTTIPQEIDAWSGFKPKPCLGARHIWSTRPRCADRAYA